MNTNKHTHIHTNTHTYVYQCFFMDLYHNIIDKIKVFIGVWVMCLWLNDVTANHMQHTCCYMHINVRHLFTITWRWYLFINFGHFINSHLLLSLQSLRNNVAVSIWRMHYPFYVPQFINIYHNYGDSVYIQRLIYFKEYPGSALKGSRTNEMNRFRRFQIDHK